mgnify:CR=1 FL=1
MVNEATQSSMLPLEEPLIPNYGLSDDLEEHCDNIDASFFSGYSIHSPAASARLKMYIERWTKQVEHIEATRIRSEYEE